MDRSVRLKLHWNVAVILIFTATCALSETIKTEYIDGLSQQNCSSTYFTCASGSLFCIPLKWRCDDDFDCEDGSDEAGCGPCSESELRCNDGKCISHGWVCDGEKDCRDGSDENSVTCQFDDNCHYFGASCRSPPHDCIPFEKLCNGKNDCPNDMSDEDHCLSSLLSAQSCRNLDCHYKCAVLPSGLPTCYCPAGQILNETDNSTCFDANICLLTHPCDHVCHKGVNGWSYTCSCFDGFALVNNTVCVANIAISIPEPYLVVLQASRIQKFYLNGSSFSQALAVDAETMDFNLQNNELCWITKRNSTQSSRLFCSDLDDFRSTNKIELPFNLNEVVEMRIDWITDNMYFINGFPGQLFVCNKTRISRCKFLGSNPNEYRYLSLALDAHSATLFIGIGGKYAQVISMAMDGKHNKTIVRQKLTNPAKITLDIFAQRVYIYDKYIDSFDSVSYNGTNRRIVAKLSNYLLSGLTYFNNTLFLSSSQNQSLAAINVNQDLQGRTQLATSAQFNSVHVVHPLTQWRRRWNGSDFNTLGFHELCNVLQCDHLCLLGVSPHQSVTSSCHCSFDYTLAADGHTCRELPKEQKFLIYYASLTNEIEASSLAPNQSLHVPFPPIHFASPKAMDYYRDDDGADWIMYTEDSPRQSPTTLQCEDLSVDWMNDNVFCLSSNFGKIIVSSLQQPQLDSSQQYYPRINRFDPAVTAYKTLDFKHAIYINILSSSHSIVVHPAKRRLYWATNFRIYSSWMNGANVTTFLQVSSSIPLHPESLTIDYDQEVLYWADKLTTGIAMVNLNTKKMEVLFRSSTQSSQQFFILPGAIAFFENNQPGYPIGRYLYFAENLNGNIYRLNLDNINDTSFPANSVDLVQETSNLFTDLLVFDPSTKTGVGPCKRSHCTDLCVPIPEEPQFVCLCPDNKNLSADGVTCEGVDAPISDTAPLCRAEEFRCTNGRCIHEVWVCDGRNDCRDGSDESETLCGNWTCYNSRFYCNSTRTCISSRLVCDGDDDCSEGEDEIYEACQTHKCAEDDFTCANGACVWEGFVCDDDEDCLDGSDEQENCTRVVSCDSGEFRCLNRRCILTDWLCDGDNDCGDESDEENCDPESNLPPESPNCQDPDSFVCQSNDRVLHCIPEEWRCDGDSDCFDGKDETNCSHVACQAHSRPCASGKCIFKSWWCDGEIECADSLDEANCSCPENQIRCLTSSFTYDCVASCNGTRECVNGNDEKNCSHTLSCNDDPCSHTCVERPDASGYECLCPTGKTLGSDQRTCEDISYCSELGRCSQNCTEDATSYRCSCYTGWHVDPMDTSGDKCVYDVADPPPFVLYATRHALKYFLLDSNARNHSRLYSTRKSMTLLDGLRHLLAFDYHYEKKLIFYSDVTNDAISRAKFGYYRRSRTLYIISNKIIISQALPSTEGIAVDWIAERIYFVDSSRDHIEVADFNGNHRSVLVAGDMDNPRALAVDPRYGYMFWTVWDTNDAKVERATLAGENRTTLWSLGKENSGWPNGLTIDYLEERIYWAGAKYDMIWATKYDGKNVIEILSNVAWMSHPFAITTYAHHLLWTDWQTRLIGIAEKWPGSSAFVLEITFSKPYDIKIFHESRQPRTTTNSSETIVNPCANVSCGGLCVVSPGAVRHQCVCPYQHQLNSDGTCQPLGSYMLIAYSRKITGLRLVNLNFSAIHGAALPNVQNLTRLAYDASRDQVYWSDASKLEIIRAFVNGSGVETVIGVDSPDITGLVVDWLREKIYWISIDVKTSQFRLYLATFNGRFKYRLDNASSPTWNKLTSIRYLTTDVVAAKLYFVADSGIYQVHMDGTKLRRISKLTSISDLRFFGNHLYCVNNGLVFRFDIGKCFHGYCAVQLNYTATMIALMSSGSVFTLDKEEGVIKECRNGSCLIRLNKKELRQVKDLLVFDKSEQNKTNLTNVPCAAGADTCDQVCLPTTRNTSQCRCTIGYLPNTRNPSACDGVSEFLIYSTSDSVRGLPLNKSTDESLISFTDLLLARGVDFLAEKDMIIWLEASISSVKAAYRNMTKTWTIYSPYRETDDKRVATGYSGHHYEGIAVDWIAKNIYWTDGTFKEVKVVRVDGMYPYTVLRGKQGEFYCAIAVHPTLGYLFIGDCSSHGRIFRTKLDGSYQTRIKNGIGAPNGMTIDYNNSRLYWSDTNRNKIRSSDFDGKNGKVVYGRYQRGIWGITLHKGQLYWTDSGFQGGAIMTCNASSCDNPKTLDTNLGSFVKAIAVYSHLRQRGLNNICAVKNGGCEQLCFHLGSNQRRCACSFGYLNPADNQTCLPSERYVLFSDRKRIYSVDIDDPRGPNDPLPLIENPLYMKFVIAMANDFKNKRIFYSDSTLRNIYAFDISFDGKRMAVPEVVVQNAEVVEGLAYHNGENALYWTSFDFRAIMKHDLSSQLRNSSVTVVGGFSNADLLRAIVLYECENPNLIFWTNWNPNDPSIYRASIKGNNLTKIISSNIHKPNGLTIDPIVKHIYWVDATLDKIERSNFEGLNRKVIKGRDVEHGFALAVLGEYLYWTDWTRDRVERANKWTGLNAEVVRTVQYSSALSVMAFYNDTCFPNPCRTHHCDYSCVVSEEGDPQCMCPDGSISDNCTGQERRCPADMFPCTPFGSVQYPTQCIPYDITCDGQRDCSDGMDEDPLYCNSRVCRAGYSLCSNNDRCIPNNTVCDGVDNCRDGLASDEHDCPDPTQTTPATNSTCSHGRFTCNNGQCIPKSWKCDGDRDCLDGSDEKCEIKCSSGTMECKVDDKCIPNSYKCDGEEDCSDGSDEKDCDISGCQPGHLKCASSDHCILLRWVCDGGDDCPDGSDEKSCGESFCGRGRFECQGSQMCIDEAWTCDREFDCPDGSDEGSWCSYSKCDGMLCDDHVTCIEHDYKCDGDSDCPSGEDEKDCSAQSGCNATTHIQCPDQVTCIPLTRACDGVDDCQPDPIDETNCNVDECSDPSLNNCHQRCVEKPYSYSCDCFRGYRLLNEQHTCLDVNECQEMDPYPPCSQVCNNMKGSYRCSCAGGYYRDPRDPSNCQAHSTSAKPYIIYTNEHYLHRLNLNGLRQTDKILAARLNLGRGIAVDYDWRQEKVYWCLFYMKRTYFFRHPLNDTKNTYTRPRPFHQVHGEVSRIAVDWVASNLYWTDKTSRTISILSLDDAKHSKVLISTNLSKPAAIVVDPRKGYLFWSDWGENPYIGRSGMDGSQQVVLLHNQMLGKNFSVHWPGRKLGWPNALALDPPSKRLFWADAKEDYIASCDYDGRRPRMVPLKYFGRTPGFHIFSMSIFEDRLYYADWGDKSIKSVHKFRGLSRNGSKADIVLPSAPFHPMDLKVAHPALQPPPIHPHPCTVNNGGCEDLCLIQPGGTYKCDCPTNFYLGRNKRTCLSNCLYSEFACDNDKCIPLLYKCDGVDDCGDNSDEPNTCGPFHCRRLEFQCFNSTKTNYKCIRSSAICDGIMQCPDGSDELNCDLHVCETSQMKCNQSRPPRCIAASRRCDGERDCNMGEDEADCPSPRDCTAEEFQCTPNSIDEPVIPSIHRCIPIAWRCDGELDCVGGVDEKNCPLNTCEENFFRCSTKSQCIPDNHLCDNKLDCADGSDESTIACFRGCKESEFECKTNKFCIPKRFVCDGDYDCLTGDDSDEENCQAPQTHCGEGLFQCATSRYNVSCINMEYRCDDEEDCIDGSDEMGCADVTCHDDKFKCDGTRTCIPHAFRCDGFAHCVNATDEVNCTDSPIPASCPPYMFRCMDGECIPLRWACDGQIDCYDSSDEGPFCTLRNCTIDRPLRCGDVCYSQSHLCDRIQHCLDGNDEPERCKVDQFHGHASNSTHCVGWHLQRNVNTSTISAFLCPDGRCIPTATLCDENDNCPHGFDERICRNDSCGDSNPCWDIHNSACHPLPPEASGGSYKSYCKCKKGYQPRNISSGRLFCGDMNECEALSPCSHQCRNLQGGFQCFCQEGWVLFNNIHCRSDFPVPPLLAVAAFSPFRLRFYNFIEARINLKYIRNISGIENDGEYNIDRMVSSDDGATIYACDAKKAVIYMIENSHAVPIKYLPPNHRITGLALDATGHNLLWTDSANISVNILKIGMYQRPHRRKRTVISHSFVTLFNRNNSLQWPLDVAAQPNSNFIFVADGGDNVTGAAIYKFDVLQRLKSNKNSRIISSNIEWPVSLSVDKLGKRLYWSDSKRKTISSSDYDGKMVKVVYAFTDNRPKLINVFGDFIFVSLYLSNGIVRINKLSNVLPFGESIPAPWQSSANPLSKEQFADFSWIIRYASRTHPFLVIHSTISTPFSLDCKSCSHPNDEGFCMLDKNGASSCRCETESSKFWTPCPCNGVVCSAEELCNDGVCKCIPPCSKSPSVGSVFVVLTAVIVTVFLVVLFWTQCSQRNSYFRRHFRQLLGRNRRNNTDGQPDMIYRELMSRESDISAPASPATSHTTTGSDLVSRDPTKVDGATDMSSSDYRMHYSRGDDDTSETVQLLFPSQSQNDKVAAGT